MKDTLCIGGGHSHHQFGVNLVGFHAIIFTVSRVFRFSTGMYAEPIRLHQSHDGFMWFHSV